MPAYLDLYKSSVIMQVWLSGILPIGLRGARGLLGEFLARHAPDEPRISLELLVHALIEPATWAPCGRQRLGRVRPSTLTPMWRMTWGLMFFLRRSAGSGSVFGEDKGSSEHRRAAPPPVMKLIAVRAGSNPHGAHAAMRGIQ